MNGLKDVIFQKLDVFKADILKEVPNLKPEHYLTLVNLFIRNEIGKGFYAGLLQNGIISVISLSGLLT